MKICLLAGTVLDLLLVPLTPIPPVHACTHRIHPPVLPSIAIATAAAATRGVHARERDRRESGAVRELVRAEVGDGSLPPMQVQGLRFLFATDTASASRRSATAAA